MLASRYRQAVASEEAATRALEPLTAKLGDPVQARFVEMRRRPDARQYAHLAIASRARSSGSHRSTTIVSVRAASVAAIITNRRPSRVTS